MRSMSRTEMLGRRVILLFTITIALPVCLAGQQCVKSATVTRYVNCKCGANGTNARAACYKKTVLATGAACGEECESCYVVCAKNPLPPPAAASLKIDLQPGITIAFDTPSAQLSSPKSPPTPK
jgi:hypothetical protein